MTESAIKATKPQPARSTITYPEAIWMLTREYKSYVNLGEDGYPVISALCVMFQRQPDTVQADLERGHV